MFRIVMGLCKNLASFLSQLGYSKKKEEGSLSFIPKNKRYGEKKFKMCTSLSLSFKELHSVFIKPRAVLNFLKDIGSMRLHDTDRALQWTQAYFKAYDQF